MSAIGEINYHERLKKLGIYSLQRRRERFRLINVWQQLEGIKENAVIFKQEERVDKGI